jgi:hypothetical protein
MGQKKTPPGTKWVVPAELKEALQIARSAQVTAVTGPPRRKNQKHQQSIAKSIRGPFQTATPGFARFIATISAHAYSKLTNAL